MTRTVARGLLWGCAVLSLPFLAYGVTTATAMVLNNRLLGQFERALYDYPLPVGSSVVDRHSNFELMGNGEHCDIDVTQILRTPLSRDEVYRYYAAAGLVEALKPTRGGEAVYVQVRDTAQEVTGERQVIVDLISPGWDRFFSLDTFDPRC